MLAEAGDGFVAEAGSGFMLTNSMKVGPCYSPGGSTRLRDGFVNLRALHTFVIPDERADSTIRPSPL